MAASSAFLVLPSPLLSDRIFSHPSPLPHPRRAAFPYYSKINSGHEHRRRGLGSNLGDEVWQVSDTRQPFQKRDVTLAERRSCVQPGQCNVPPDSLLLRIVRENSRGGEGRVERGNKSNFLPSSPRYLAGIQRDFFFQTAPRRETLLIIFNNRRVSSVSGNSSGIKKKKRKKRNAGRARPERGEAGTKRG